MFSLDSDSLHQLGRDESVISEVDAFFEWYIHSGWKNPFLPYWIVRRKIASLERGIQDARDLLLVSQSFRIFTHFLNPHPRICNLKCNQPFELELSEPIAGPALGLTLEHGRLDLAPGQIPSQVGRTEECSTLHMHNWIYVDRSCMLHRL